MGKLLSFLGIASAEDIASLKEDINKSTAHSISDCLRLMFDKQHEVLQKVAGSYHNDYQKVSDVLSEVVSTQQEIVNDMKVLTASVDKILVGLENNQSVIRGNIDTLSVDISRANENLIKRGDVLADLLQKIISSNKHLTQKAEDNETALTELLNNHVSQKDILLLEDGVRMLLAASLMEDVDNVLNAKE